MHDAAAQLVLIIALGIGSQWLGWRLGLPAILPLLVAGFLAGPVAGVLNPDALLGGLLFPVVSLAVALILLEGGLSLKFSELKEVRGAVRLLVSLGALLTWGLGGVAAYFLLGLSVQLSALLAAVLVVSGPTVVLPLLKFVQPSERVASILKWEGIIVDPVGATLAVLVFGAVGSGSFGDVTLLGIVGGILITLLAGGLIGFLAGRAVVLMFSRNVVPEYLHTAVVITLGLLAYVAANFFREEAGLMAVTVMGIALANQRKVNVKHVVAFKEELGVLLLSFLFIVLSGRLELSSFAEVGFEALVFVAVLLLLVRPLAVWVSTLGSGLLWRERVFLAALAPRGIVAASVASLFALELTEAGVAGAEALVPLTFIVVVGSVAVAAFTSAPIARRLGVVRLAPQGTLIIGAHGWARQIANALREAGFETVLVDTNSANVRAAKAAGLTAFEGNILSATLRDELPLSGLGRVLALTPNDELNALAALTLADTVGADNVYVIGGAGEDLSGAQRAQLEARSLFGARDYAAVNRLFTDGAEVRPLDADGETSLPLFAVGERLKIITADSTPVVSGERIIGVVAV